MIVLCGKTLSGKTTVLQALEKLGYERVRTYTTRARRPGENENAYHFVDKETFLRMKEEGAFWEDVTVRDEYYGSPAMACNDFLRKVIVLTPDAAKKAKENSNGRAMVVLLDIKDETAIARAAKRGDDVEAVRKRLIEDNRMLQEYGGAADFTIRSNSVFSAEDMAAAISVLYSLWTTSTTRILAKEKIKNKGERE